MYSLLKLHLLIARHCQIILTPCIGQIIIFEIIAVFAFTIWFMSLIHKVVMLWYFYPSSLICVMKCWCGYVPPSDTHVCGLNVATENKELGSSTPKSIQIMGAFWGQLYRSLGKLEVLFGKLALNTITVAYKIKCWMRRMNSIFWYRPVSKIYQHGLTVEAGLQ